MLRTLVPLDNRYPPLQVRRGRGSTPRLISVLRRPRGLLRDRRFHHRGGRRKFGWSERAYPKPITATDCPSRTLCEREQPQFSSRRNTRGLQTTAQIVEQRIAAASDQSGHACRLVIGSQRSRDLEPCLTSLPWGTPHSFCEILLRRGRVVSPFSVPIDGLPPGLRRTIGTLVPLPGLASFSKEIFANSLLRATAKHCGRPLTCPHTR